MRHDTLYDRVALRCLQFSRQITRRKRRALIGVLAAADADAREAQRRTPNSGSYYKFPGEDWRGRFG